jgi:hypothetical protein
MLTLAPTFFFLSENLISRICYRSAIFLTAQLFFNVFRVELLAFLIAYSFLSALYWNYLVYEKTHKEYFELMCIYASR